jgi:hypothetical protein
MRSKKNSPKIIEIILDVPLYERLKAQALVEGNSESKALLFALKRGMRDFHLHVMADNKEDYAIIRRLKEDCERDNSLLKSIENQNINFQSLIRKSNKGSDTGA